MQTITITVGDFIVEEHRLSFSDNEDYYYDIRKRKKKNKKTRIIHAPSPKLKLIQKDFAEWFYKHKKKEFNVSSQVTGFMPGKSIADNAAPHVKKDWVVNLDVKDFFPSTSLNEVKELIKSLPRSKNPIYWFRKNKPTGFKRLTDENLTNLLVLKNGLPQGSPASPLVANYIGIKEIDISVAAIVSVFESRVSDLSYTRYADDLTISFNGGTREDAQDIVSDISKCINIGIYKIKDEKTKIKHRSQRQSVTGVIVNGEDPRIDRRLMNNMRAAIHNSKKKNIELSAEIKGMMSFIQSINKSQYDKLSKQLGE